MTTEAERQQALMAAILQRGDGAALESWVDARSARVARGLQAYQANAGASAERALAAAFPTVQALVGDESFAALSRAFWHAEPPQRGDLAQLGLGLPAFIAASEQLADVPYLADVARLDWHLAEAERALDAQLDAETLQRLTDTDPAHLRLVLLPGVAVVASDYPIVSLWKAHQPGDDAAEHRGRARQQLAQGQGEHALVWRTGWRAHADIVDPTTACWMQALLRGESLATALVQAGEGFEFEPWLVHALQQQWLWRAEAV